MFRCGAFSLAAHQRVFMAAESRGLVRFWRAVAQGVDAKTMSLQYLEALKSIGASPATKFVFPMELTTLLRPFTHYAEQATPEKR